MTDRQAQQTSREAVAGFVGTDAITGAIGRHVGTLRDAQAALKTVLDQKRTALIDGAVDAMQRMAAEEERLTSEFARLERERAAILASAHQAGSKATTLTTLAKELNVDQKTQDELAAVRDTAAHIQRETWTQLIVAARSARHYDELIGLIATGGDKPESYEDEGTSTGYEASGGNLLDAAA